MDIGEKCAKAGENVQRLRRVQRLVRRLPGPKIAFMPPQVVRPAERHHIRRGHCRADRGVSPKDDHWSSGHVTQGDLSPDWVTEI